MQSNVILWLVALPLVLAAFRAITIGDRLYSPVQPGREGGHHNQLLNLALAGLTLVGLMLMFIVAGGVRGSEDPLAITLLAFGGFVLAGYLASGFRTKTWEKFLSHALHEAGLFWLVLGLCRMMLILVDQAEATTGTAALPRLTFLQSVVWGVIAAVSLALIIGTAARMKRR